MLDAYGNPTIYYRNEDLRLQSIERYTKPEVLYNRTQFVWEDIDLVSKELFDEQGVSIQKVQYLYDEYGNVLRQELWGDLTGEGSQQVHAKICTYSQDGKHLLLTQEEERGPRICYSYHKDTDLVAQELHCDEALVCLEKKRSYDDHHNLIEEEIKDHIGNTRRSYFFKLRSDKGPYPGMPEFLEELAGGSLLKKNRLPLQTRRKDRKRGAF